MTADAETKDETRAAKALLSAAAVRNRAKQMLALADADRLTYWRLDRTQLPVIADYVLKVMRANYPALDIPFHARWRHFMLDGSDRATLYKRAGPAFPGDAERSRAAFDLAIVSVLLDAGAGPGWFYRMEDGRVTTRSEGLAMASFDMFEKGVFSASRNDPRRADASALIALTPDDLRRGMQVNDNNPLAGLDGRAALLNALGHAVAARPDLFGKETPRPGGLYDHLRRLADGGALPAPVILAALLDAFGPIWPDRPSLGGIMLGDTWTYAPLAGGDIASGLVPFHKLSQWLAYSLIEPLQWAGVEVTDIDGLTGLAEYRNGGLFIDLGALVLKDEADRSRQHAPASGLVVEWRALTVALLDEIAAAIRGRLGLDAASMPLAKILEGGTWSAGRRSASERRSDGAPPLHIVSDGTLF